MPFFPVCVAQFIQPTINVEMPIAHRFGRNRKGAANGPGVEAADLLCKRASPTDRGVLE